MEALEAEIYQDKEVITRLNREKSALEAEVTVLRVSSGQRSRDFVMLSVNRHLFAMTLFAN